MNRENIEKLQVSETIVNDALMVSLYICPYMKFISVNPKVNDGLWVIMICQCTFISCGKCAVLWETDDGNGRGYSCVGAGDTWKLHFLFSFAVNLKLLQK